MAFVFLVSWWWLKNRSFFMNNKILMFILISFYVLSACEVLGCKYEQFTQCVNKTLCVMEESQNYSLTCELDQSVIYAGNSTNPLYIMANNLRFTSEFAIDITFLYINFAVCNLTINTKGNVIMKYKTRWRNHEI
jgi:hypothetical protein